MVAKKPKAEAPAAPSQLERATAAVARLPRFDKLWLERLELAIAESKDKTKDDLSIDREAATALETLLRRAKDWNLLRSHPSFPKSFVGD